MKIILGKVLPVYLLISFLLSSNSKDYENFLWVKSLPNPWTFSTDELDKVLVDFQIKYPDFYNRLIAINLWRLNTPYRIFCLGEESGIDKDPIIRIDSSDCTVHVLTSLVLAESNSWSEARKKMVELHYKVSNGHKKPTYESRWHFTSDRIISHRMTPNITPNVVDKKLMKHVNVNINMKSDSTEFLNLNWNTNHKIGYLPTKNISEITLKNLPKICGVAFVKESYFKMGVVIAHEGFLINGKDFIHASSKRKKTVRDDFFTYIFEDGKPRFDGIMLFKINQF